MRKLLIVLSAFALVVAFTVPAMAEVSFYGNVRLSTGMTSVSEEKTGTFDDSDLDWALDTGCSRVGANFKNEDVGANVEIRPHVTSYFRHWYGWWDAGFGKLIVGQTWTPTFNPIDDSVYLCGQAVASMGGSVRQPQIALHTGGLKVALRTPSTSAVAGGVEQDTALPAVEASYKLKAGPAGITLFLGYNAFDDVDATDKAYSVTSHVAGGNVELSFGAASIKATVWTSQNGAEGGFFSDAVAAMLVGTKIKDSTSTGFAAAFGYAISDTMKIQAGYGSTSSEVDVAGTEADTESGIYVNLPITLAKGVTLTPEIDMLDHGEDTAGADQGSTTSYGVYWKIDF